MAFQLKNQTKEYNVDSCIVNWQMIIGISSTIIALCALGYSVYQGYQIRIHNKLSVRPHLSTWTHSNVEERTYTVELINNGLGPAVIDNFVVKIDGKKISGDGTEPIEKALKTLFPRIPYHAHQSYVAQGYSMAPKERCKVVEVKFTETQFPSPEEVEQALRRSDLEITYKSYYGEIFHFSSQEERS